MLHLLLGLLNGVSRLSDSPDEQGAGQTQSRSREARSGRSDSVFAQTVRPARRACTNAAGSGRRAPFVGVCRSPRGDAGSGTRTAATRTEQFGLETDMTTMRAAVFQGKGKIS